MNLHLREVGSTFTHLGLRTPSISALRDSTARAVASQAINRQNQGGMRQQARLAASDPKRSLALPATGLLLLDGWTRYRAVRTEHAAVALLRPQHRAATGTFMEKLTSRRRHRLGCLVPTLRAGQGALKLQLSHRSASPSPGNPPRRLYAPTRERWCARHRSSR